MATEPLIIDIVDEQPKQLAAKASTWQEKATALVVRDQQNYDMGVELVKGIKALSAEAEKTFRPTIDAAHKAHKTAVAALKSITDPLEAAERQIKNKLVYYTQDMERQRREAEARAAEEARRIQAEQFRQQQEAQRQAEEAARLQREQEIEAAVESLEQQGASSAEIAAVIQEAEAAPIVVAPVFVPAPPPPPVPVSAPAFEKAKGAAVRTKVRAEVVDPASFLRWVAADPSRLNLAQANLPALNKFVNALGLSASIPGVRLVEEANMAIR